MKYFYCFLLLIAVVSPRIQAKKEEPGSKTPLTSIPNVQLGGILLGLPFLQENGSVVEVLKKINDKAENITNGLHLGIPLLEGNGTLVELFKKIKEKAENITNGLHLGIPLLQGNVTLLELLNKIKEKAENITKGKPHSGPPVHQEKETLVEILKKIKESAENIKIGKHVDDSTGIEYLKDCVNKLENITLEGRELELFNNLKKTIFEAGDELSAIYSTNGTKPDKTFDYPNVNRILIFADDLINVLQLTEKYKKWDLLEQLRNVYDRVRKFISRPVLAILTWLA